MPPTYGLSSYGKVMLIDEGIIEAPWLRSIYLAINALLYLIPSVMITKQYLGFKIKLTSTTPRSSSSSNISSSLWLITSIFITFLINNFIRTCHMIDHAYRPVYYHEPEWAYKKYLIVEMELATYSNIIISLCGLFGLRRLLNYIVLFTERKQQQFEPRLSYLLLNGIYIFGSLFNFVHYTIEPPWNYGPFPNFNIAGAPITVLPYIGLILYTLFYWNPSYSSSSSKDREQRKKLISDASSSSGNVRITRSAAKRARTPQ